MSQNHYQVLGVAPNAPAAVIKRAYRQLVVRFHPDKHGGDVRYEDQFKAVAAAYRVLGDPGRRAAYDFQLAQAGRRAEEQRRQSPAHAAAASPHGYGAPRPAPLRTRPPAGARERHYQPIARRPTRFTRRDWVLTLLLVLGIGLFATAVKVTMDRVSATSNYADGLRAYTRGQWAAAYSFLDETLHFRPNYGPALRRHGELELLANHDPRAALADFRAALLQHPPPRAAAAAWYYLGRSQTQLARPAAAARSFSRALQRDSTRSAAYLARGETRLLDLQQPRAALADLTRGLRQRQRAGGPPPWHYVQLRGVALSALGQYPAARAEYLRVVRAWPQDGRTHFLLGRLAAHTGDTTAACECYRRALALGYAYARTAQNRCR